MWEKILTNGELFTSSNLNLKKDAYKLLCNILCQGDYLTVTEITREFKVNYA